MKNVILFIVDSMNYSHVKLNPTLTPFLNSLKEQGTYFENMYSEAPYTEAATMNIYCGQSVLDRNGHVRRFADAKKTVFESMKERGYRTYYNAFQPQCFPSSLRRGIDDIYYNVGFDLSALWSYRLYFYADLLSSGKITEEDYGLLTEIFDDNFNEWLIFVNALINDDKSVQMIKDNSLSYDAESVKKSVEEQLKLYNANKKEYINGVLQQKTSHPLFKIPAFNQDNKIKNKDFYKTVYEKYIGLFKGIKRKNKKLNRKNCKGAITLPLKKAGKLICHPNKENLKNLAKCLLISLNVYKDTDLFTRINYGYETFKNAPSVKTHVDHYINWQKSVGDTPTFSCIHVDDVHNPEVFFTYDTDDLKLIDSEMQDARNVLDKLPKDYYGNITHDLSLRYIDRKTEYLFDELKKNGLLDNTVVLICADHGFSFSGNPLRDSAVINMYLENFNIPCVIYGSEYKGKNELLCQSKDIASMLSFLADGKEEESFNGKNMLTDKDGYQSVFIEYCGGGCPDISRRKIKLGCFDKEYFVATCSTVDGILTEKDVTEIYDLNFDPLQKRNLVGKKYDKQKVNALLQKINDRRKVIRQN